MKTYKEFIKQKQVKNIDCGFDIDEKDINEILFPFQKFLVKWAIKKGRSSIFADTGLGKTFMQIEIARLVQRKISKPCLIFAPLCVAHQTVREAKKLGVIVEYVRDMPVIHSSIQITNYEMMDKFDFNEYDHIILDESSIIKHQHGKIRKAIIEKSKNVPYKHSFTATPAPNDFMELGNQAEFIGVMSMVEMLAMYFIHDGGSTSKWRLKGHGAKIFWEWLSTWAILIKKPSDLGFNDDGYDLPPLNMIGHIVETKAPIGCLFPEVALSLLDRNSARRDSVIDRVKKCADIVNDSKHQFVIWCHLNRESELLSKSIEDSKDVKGSDSIEYKEKTIQEFTDGKLRVLITKPSIAGFGMNWQHIHNMCFVGLSDSWEQFYQAIRREWRFGQTKKVNVHVISADSEGAVLDNIKRKEKQASEMVMNMIKCMTGFTKKQFKSTEIEKMDYKTRKESGDNWDLYLGDCVDVFDGFKENSIDYSIFSPPFASLYTYSNSDRDMGNCANNNEFVKQFDYLVKHLFRVIKPGRLVSFHCMNLPASLQHDGFIGLKDFRGELIKQFIDSGFIYHSEVCIWKDPVIAMQRTKALGLLWKQIKKDSSRSRMGVPDYVVTMRKPGENLTPVSHTPEDYPVKKWQQVASPIWTDINPSNTLNKNPARENEDERHICPLQLDVIERCLELWTNPGDLVASPFAGIGSEGYQSLKMGRKFIGSELKESYFNVAVDNLKSAKQIQTNIFDE